MKQLKQHGYLYGALLYCFLVPLPQKWATIALGFWLLLSLLNLKKLQHTKKGVLLLLPILYSTYFLNFFISEVPYVRFIETKLSFLIFPALFFIHAYTKQERQRMFKMLVFGLIVAIAICVIAALYRSLNMVNGSLIFQANVLPDRGFFESILYGGNYFFGRYFSILHQTVYFSLYLCIGVTILLFQPKMFQTKMRILLLLLFVMTIFLISNKANFIALAVLFVLYVLFAKVALNKKVFGVVGMGLVFAFFIWMNPRSHESLNKITEGALAINKDARFGFATRILSWDAAVTLIQNKPIVGYGPGETQEQLNAVYQQKAYKFPLQEQYNAHNLWLQTWLENGMFGLLLLCAIFVLAFKAASVVKENRNLYLSLVVLLLINSMFESMFHRFSGITIFSFIVCLIFTIPQEDKAKA